MQLAAHFMAVQLAAGRCVSWWRTTAEGSKVTMSITFSASCAARQDRRNKSLGSALWAREGKGKVYEKSKITRFVERLEARLLDYQ